MTTQTATKPTALDAFLARKFAIEAQLARLTAECEDHFGVGPDEINWNHVGTLQEIERMLKRVTDFTFAEGENK